MLHLFNKVYLEFDDKLDINYDRVVISEEHGIPMLETLDKIAYGELLTYGKTFDEVVTESFSGWLAGLKSFGAMSGKKVIIYCDKKSYKMFLANWLKVILPDLTFDEFKTIVDYTIYNQRVTSNTQLSSVYSMNLNFLWEDIGEIEGYWNDAPSATTEQLSALKQLNLSLSYEFLLATYLSDSNERKEELRTTVHMFLRRWFKEMFTDNRQMVLLNITNRKFQEAMEIDPTTVDITSLDPLSNIPSLASYADDEIWERDETQYGACKLEGLSQEKAEALRDTLVNIFTKFEGMETDRSAFEVSHWILYAIADSLTDEALDDIVNQMVNNPFDTIGVPRFDFQNVNFPLIQYFLAQKFNGEDLSKYRLL